MSLNGAIAEHATGEYTVTRRTGGAWTTDGEWTEGAPSTFTIVASVQPAGEDLQDLPEGMSLDDVRMVYTETELIPLRDGVEPDYVEILGKSYRVQKCSRWDHWGETHYVATCFVDD